MASAIPSVMQRRLTWLITGSSSGFGLALARYALSHGHNVIATSRNPSRDMELVKDFEDKGGKWLKLDVNDPHSGQIVDDVEKQGTPIDVLVNNAGFSMHGPVEAFSDDEVRDQFETIFFGPYRLMRVVLPYMRKRRSGTIVNISAAGAIWGSQSMGPYSAAKAALDGISKVLADEIQDFGVRILIVQLGGFNTNMANAIKVVQKPLDEDYKDTALDRMTKLIKSGAYPLDGDKDKASQAIYEVIVGEGIGNGKERELILPLGKDVLPRAQRLIDGWTHAMDVFGGICNNVSVER